MAFEIVLIAGPIVEEARVGVSPGLAQETAAGEDAWTGDPALIHQLCDPEDVAPGIASRREPLIQILEENVRRVGPGRHLIVVRPELLHSVPQTQVGVHVDQAGHQRAAFAVDRERTGRLDRLGRDRLDQVPLDEDVGVLDAFCANAVEDVHVREEHLPGLLLSLRQRGRGQEERNQQRDACDSSLLRVHGSSPVSIG